MHRTSHASHDPSFPGDADALLFDLGRVVLDIDFSKALACWAAHASCAPSASPRALGVDETYRHHERGKISDEAFFEGLRRSLGIAITDEQFLEGWNAIFAGEMDGIAPLLERAARQLPPLRLLQHQSRARRRTSPGSTRTRSAVSASSSFPPRSECENRKPQAFAHVVKAMGVPASRIVFFDDLADNVESARSLGIKAVQVKSSRDIADALTALGV